MLSAIGNVSLPPQMIPLKDKIKKDKQWAKTNLDSLESIGRQQFVANARLIENYEMVRGKFIFSHYVDSEEYGDMISQLSREFDIPSHLRHYDIISQVINTLSGEYQKRPDLFRVKDGSQKSQNNYLRQKTQMLQTWVKEEIDTYINQQLLAEGLDPDAQDFQSQEEYEQYQQQIEQRRQALTPPEIQKYMNTTWMDESEIWGNNQVEFDKQRFNLPEKEKIEFEDMLIADRCFRHFYITANGYNQETWNPINTFYHKSPEIRYIENGDYVGRVTFQTSNEIVNRYGYKMNEKQLELLESWKKAAYEGKNGWQSEWSGLPPNTIMPYENYPEQRFVMNQLGFNPNTPYNIDAAILRALGDGDSLNYTTAGLFQVTEGYWMSMRRVGKFTYQDPETGELQTILVDETFNLPGVEEIETSFMEYAMGVERPGTVVWTWVPQVWQGIKISNTFSNLAEPIYIDLKPSDFQFRGDMNIYGAKLPVCGQIFHNRNADSSSLVDLMKPHQIGHNVAMNQLYEIMQREVGRFWLMDMNVIPSGKDWGGERNYEKLMMVAKQLGIAPVDASPSNTRNSNFAHFQMVDLDESSRMLSRANLATFFETQAQKQVGISPQRLGETTASESATGVQNAISQSFAQTESYFTDFSNYKKRCLTMGLEIAQYIASKEEDIILNFIKDDMSRAFSKISGTDLLLSEFGILIVNSQELIRQLETLRQLFLENNTTGASPVDLATVVTSNSPAEIKIQLQTTYEALQQQKAQEQQQVQQMQQQQIQANAQEAEKQRQHDDYRDDLHMANERYIAEIKALGFSKNTDSDQNGVPDVLEVQRLALDAGSHTDDILFKRTQENNKLSESLRKAQVEQDKLKLQREQMEEAKRQANEKNRVEREKMKNDYNIEKMKAKSKPKPIKK